MRSFAKLPSQLQCFGKRTIGFWKISTAVVQKSMRVQESAIPLPDLPAPLQLPCKRECFVNKGFCSKHIRAHELLNTCGDELDSRQRRSNFGECFFKIL
jgi:hypothetical protein